MVDLSDCMSIKEAAERYYVHPQTIRSRLSDLQQNPYLLSAHRTGSFYFCLERKRFINPYYEQEAIVGLEDKILEKAVE